MDRLCIDDLGAFEWGQPFAIRPLLDGAGIAAAVDPGDDCRGQGDAGTLNRDRSGQRGNRSLQQLGRAVIIALVQGVDRAEIAAQAQLDRVARRNRLGLGKQAFSLAELAEVRALQRAVQGEFGRVDVGGDLVVLGAA